MPGGMTRGELLTAASRHLGHPVKPDQLKALRANGLISRPTARKSGVPIYPPGTLEQLVAIRRLQEQERRFDELRVLAWWEGYWVAFEPLVKSLAKILDEEFSPLRKARAEHAEPERAAEAVLEDLRGLDRSRSPVVRLFRKRLKRDDEDLRSAAYALLVYAFGGEPIWHLDNPSPEESERSPLELVESFIGIPRLIGDMIPGAGAFLPDNASTLDILALLRDAGVLDLEHPGRTFLETSREELETARTQARAVWNLSQLADLLEHSYGRDFAGLGLLGAIRKRDVYLGMAFVARLWLLIAPVLPSEAVANFVGGADYKGVAAAIELIEVFPGYKPFLTPGSEERLAALPQEERDHIATVLNTYIEEHPEMLALLDT